MTISLKGKVSKILNRISKPTEMAWKKTRTKKRMIPKLLWGWQMAEMRRSMVVKKTKRKARGHLTGMNRIMDRMKTKKIMIMTTRRAAHQALNKRDNISSSL